MNPSFYKDTLASYNISSTRGQEHLFLDANNFLRPCQVFDKDPSTNLEHLAPNISLVTTPLGFGSYCDVSTVVQLYCISISYVKLLLNHMVGILWYLY